MTAESEYHIFEIKSLMQKISNDSGDRIAVVFPISGVVKVAVGVTSDSSTPNLSTIIAFTLF